MKVERLPLMLCCGALALSVWISAANAQVYRYEKDGQVVYGDRMPVSNQSGHSVLNKHGVVFERVLSRDEQRQLEKEREKARQKEIQDRTLLHTFGSEADIALVRNRRLAMIDVQIEQVDSKAASLRARSVDLETRIKLQEANSGRGQAPEHMYAELIQTRSHFRNTLVVLNEKMIDRNNMASKFVADMNRYRELRARQ